MAIDFTPFFKEYEPLLTLADATFDRIKKAYPDEVKCRIRCADCCHAVFDVGLIEALYINHHFNRINGEGIKAQILEKANQADRKAHKLKRNAYKEIRGGKKEIEVLVEMSHERIRCPLLNRDDNCDLYTHRPITCRFYGLPTAIGGHGHTCGLSGFVEGKHYPTVNLDKIQDKLFNISYRLVKNIGSRYVKMGDMLIPLSMALLSEYDEEYLGVGDEPDADPKADQSGRNR